MPNRHSAISAAKPLGAWRFAFARPLRGHLLGLLACLVLSTPVVAVERIALLVGNAAYKTGGLTNPPNDVKVLQSTLKELGFQVKSVLNTDQKQLKRALQEFGSQAQGAGVALFYYSGHATQVAGENYLLPLGATIEKEADYEIEAVSANSALSQIASARPKAAIVILDACRDNPFASVTRSASKGLSRMDAPSGTMIAFATEPKNTAGDDGHYARVLAAELKKPGQELLDVFRNTSAEVRRLTNGKQVPRVSEMSINERIYLAGPGQQMASLAPVAVAVQPEAPTPPSAPLAPASAPVVVDALKPGSLIKDCAGCPEMVVIPAGRFTMGGAKYAHEEPRHEVSVGRFALAKTEVTQGQWRSVMGSNPSNFKACGDDCPVVLVSWEDAQAFVKKLSKKTGKVYRLPSEAEWEYACRAGGSGEYCGGNNVDALAWHDRNSGDKTNPVGRKQGNAFGLYDMSGNVSEWVEDCWNESYQGAPVDGSAWRSGNCRLHVSRSGSWLYNPEGVRAAYRTYNNSTLRTYNLGFRPARVLP